MSWRGRPSTLQTSWVASFPPWIHSDSPLGGLGSVDVLCPSPFFVGKTSGKALTKSPSGWWCNLTILKNDGVKVNGKDDIPYMKWKIKKKKFQSTNQPSLWSWKFRARCCCNSRWSPSTKGSTRSSWQPSAGSARRTKALAAREAQMP